MSMMQCMHAEQPRATEILAEETPDICASAEPGMKPKEIEEFKRKLEIELGQSIKRSCVATTSRYGRWYFCTRFQEVIQ